MIPTTTADDVRLQLQILSNTIASGEASEDACYRAIERLNACLHQMTGNPAQSDAAS